MTHTGSSKRIIFDVDTTEITKTYTGNIIVKGFSNHAYKEYEFSHFLPTSYPKSLLTHANNTSKLWNEWFGHMTFKYLQHLHNDKLVGGFPLIKSSEGVCLDLLVGNHPNKK